MVTRKLEKENVRPMKRVLTGIPGLDLVSLGGLPAGRTTLIAGSSGSCKTLMGLHFLMQGIRQFDEPGVFVTFEETPEDIRKNVEELGWSISDLEKKGVFAFVDASPVLEGVQVEISDDYDFSALMERIKYAVGKVNAKRLVIDSIGTVFSMFQNALHVRRELHRIIALLKGLGITAIITAERTKEYGSVSRFDVEEFISDNVIILRHILDDEKRRRTLEILKFRGTRHQNGEYPFTISAKGLEVVPITAITLNMESSNVRIGSGCQELDRMTGGGFHRDSVILLSGATGCGKTLLATTFANQGCQDGERTLYLAFEESPEQLKRNAASWNLPLQQFEEQGNLSIEGSYPEAMSLADHLVRIKDLCEAHQAERIVVDSMSALERVSIGKSFREFVIGLTSYAKMKQMGTLITATTPFLMGGTSVTEANISTITDAIILLRYVEVNAEMRRGITVLKMRGSEHEKFIREYQIDKNGIHIGATFKNIGGILSGTSQQLVHSEVDTMEQMFDQ